MAASKAVNRAERVVIGGLRRVLYARARDMTAQASARSAVVIAPHPDDETLGCGATIARKVEAGKAVTVVIVTDGRRSHESAVITPARLVELRREEAIEACRRLGVPEERVLFLGCEDQRAEPERERVGAELARIIGEAGPDEVYSPSPIDRNPDHRAIGAIMDGLIKSGRVLCEVYEYPVWFWTLRTWAGNSAVRANGAAAAVVGGAMKRLIGGMAGLQPRTVSTDGLLWKKRGALEAHRTQMENMTGETGWNTLPSEFVANFFGPSELFFLKRKGSAAGMNGSGGGR